MNFTYLDLYILNSKHHIQLGPDDAVSFPAVYGVSKVCCSFFYLYFLCDKRMKRTVFAYIFDPLAQINNTQIFQQDFYICTSLSQSGSAVDGPGVILLFSL